MLCDHCKDRDSVVQLVQPSRGAPSRSCICASSARAKRGVETTVAAPSPPLGEFLQKSRRS